VGKLLLEKHEAIIREENLWMPLLEYGIKASTKKSSLFKKYRVVHTIDIRGLYFS